MGSPRREGSSVSEVLSHTRATANDPHGAECDAARARSIRSAEDRAWMVEICDRDQVAFEHLFRRYERTCWKRARQILHDDGYADEVVQAVFVDVWRHAQRYDPARGAVSSWISRLTHHKAVDAVRREALHHRRRAGDDGLLLSTPCGGATPETAAQQHAEGARVRAALNKLSAPQRETLFLAYFEHRTYAEIAVLLDQPLGTVKSRGRLALVVLRGLLHP